MHDRMNTRIWPWHTPSSCENITGLWQNLPIWIRFGMTNDSTRRLDASWLLKRSTSLTMNGCLSWSACRRCKSLVCCHCNMVSAMITMIVSTQPFWTNLVPLLSVSVTPLFKENKSKFNYTSLFLMLKKYLHLPLADDSKFLFSLINHRRKKEAHILLREHFFKSQVIYTPGNLDKFLIGLATQPGQDFDNYFTEEVYTFIKKLNSSSLLFCFLP